MGQTQGLTDKCTTYLYSESNSEQRVLANRYLIGKLGYPDEGSQFERNIGFVKYIFRTPAINRAFISIGMLYLQGKGYDALLLRREDYIIGHTAFQQHLDNSWHIFSVEVNLNYVGKGLARYMAEKVLEEARKRRIGRVRIGAGGHIVGGHIIQDFAKRAHYLGIEALDDNWVRINY